MRKHHQISIAAEGRKPQPPPPDAPRVHKFLMKKAQRCHCPKKTAERKFREEKEA